MTAKDNHIQKDEDERDIENDESENENEEDDIETFKLSEIEPVLERVEQAIEKANKLLKSSMLKCEHCDFIAKNQNGLNMHKKAKHEDKST